MSDRASPRPPERLVDPHRLQLAAPAPDDPGDAGEDPAVVVADEDPELLVVAEAGGGDGGRRDVLLEQRQVGRIRRVLDDEAVRVVHRLGCARGRPQATSICSSSAASSK